jgi:hypothetical protein
MQDSQLLDNGPVSTFPWQRIDAVSDELFEMVNYIRFTSRLQKRSYSQLQSVHHRVQKSSAPVKERDSPADKNFRTDSSEVTARAPDENKKKRLLFVCNRFVM